MLLGVIPRLVEWERGNGEAGEIVGGRGRRAEGKRRWKGGRRKKEGGRKPVLLYTSTPAMPLRIGVNTVEPL